MAIPDDQLTQRIAALETQFGLPQGSFYSLVKEESGFNPSAVSPKGAQGYSQLMPATAKELGVDPLDPDQNLTGGATYFKQQWDKAGEMTQDPVERARLAYAGYNAGPGNVQKYKGVPPFPETQKYTDRNMANLEKFGYGGASMPGVPTPQEAAPQPPAPAGGEPKKKSSFMKNVLPLLFRFALPTAAGAVVGGKNPFLGSAAGALLGASAGGLSQLNANSAQDQFDAKTKLAVGKQGLEAEKLKLDEKKSNAKQDLDIKSYESLSAYRDWQKANGDAKTKTYADYVEWKKQHGNEKLKLDEKKSNAKPGTIPKEDAIYSLIGKQVGNQPLDPKNPEHMQLMSSILTSQDKTTTMDDPDNIFGDAEQVPDEAYLNSMIEQYNRYLTRGNQPELPSGEDELDPDAAELSNDEFADRYLK